MSMWPAGYAMCSSFMVHRGHTKTRTHASPDVLQHKLAVQCEASRQWTNKNQLSLTVTHARYLLFPFPEAFTVQVQNNKALSSTITYIHSIYLRDGFWMWKEEVSAVHSDRFFWHVAGENLSYRTLQSIKPQVTVATQQLITCCRDTSEIQLSCWTNYASAAVCFELCCRISKAEKCDLRINDKVLWSL